MMKNRFFFTGEEGAVQFRGYGLSPAHIGKDRAGGQPLGDATYSGKAAGMYGRKTLEQYGRVVSGSETSGHFTADANLTVRFGGNDIPVSSNYEVEGTVSTFMDGNEEISPGWILELGKADIDSGDTVSGMTTGSGKSGNWEGRFFGNPVNAAGAIGDTEGTVEAENAPTGIAGEFTGHFANGHVIGAFGATKK